MPTKNELREWSVQVLLRGDFDTAHLDGDNSKILPTDTMKNTVYSIARSSKAESMEEYAMELVDFLLGRNSQVSSAEVRVEGTPWGRISIDSKPHPDTFARGSDELQTTHVEREQQGEFKIVSGLENMLVLKTAKSGFEGYIKDSLTTLKETSDRLFGTAVSAKWVYSSEGFDYDGVRAKIRETMLKAFAEHDSKSVQQTMYAMAEERAGCGAGDQRGGDGDAVNKHCLLVDLSRFGQDNPNEIFVPTDEPHGYIEARIVRKF